MEEIITKEFIQYKTGFTAGKCDIVELIRLGKIIDFRKQDEKKLPEWYDFGYEDAMEYFSKEIDKNVDIVTISVREVVKELFFKRVLMYNSEKNQEIPISTFKTHKYIIQESHNKIL